MLKVHSCQDKKANKNTVAHSTNNKVNSSTELNPVIKKYLKHAAVYSNLHFSVVKTTGTINTAAQFL